MNAPTTYDIHEKLGRLADMRAQADMIRLHYQELRKTVIPAEIQAQLDEMDAEYKTAMDTLDGGTSELEAQIKADVLAVGETVKGGALMAVWNKGRVTWDSKLLDGLALVVPQILPARKEGEPSVTIRGVK